MRLLVALFLAGSLASCANLPSGFGGGRHLSDEAAADMADVMAQMVAKEIPPATSTVRLERAQKSVPYVLQHQMEQHLRELGFAVLTDDTKDKPKGLAPMMAQAPQEVPVSIGATIGPKEAVLKVTVGHYQISELVTLYETGRVESMGTRVRMDVE